MGNQPIGSGHLLSENRRRPNFNKFLFKYWFITLILISILYVRHKIADRDDIAYHDSKVMHNLQSK
jgi:hypothetical protein